MKYFLTKENTAIGRSSQNDICLPDPAISRTHLIIVRQGGQYIATDKSSNGTFINDERISSKELKVNDTIRLGQWTIHFLEAQDDNEPKTFVHELAPTRVLSYRPGKNELVCERGMLEIQSTPPQTYALSKAIVSLGKASSNDIVIKDEYASSHHCRIESRKDGFFIKDLQSTNGTFVEGQKIIETSLSFGSMIDIGKVRIRFFSAEETQSITPSSDTDFEGIQSRNPKMREIFTLIRKVAKSDATILVQGETGTGKELIAKAIHNQSERSDKPYITLNCGAISKDLIESELFGHEKGAFTSAHTQRRGVFEQAHGGTLFLDEIGELPLDLQPKLLRVLESGEIRRIGGTPLLDVNVRLIAATNRNLPDEVKKGQFREDLFYRLYVVPLTLPPLRNRSQDIPLLVKHFLEQEFPSRTKTSKKKIDQAAMNMLLDHPWPGNIRELKNVLGRAILSCQTSTISSGDLEFAPMGGRDRTAYEYDEKSGSTQTFPKTLKDVEKERILAELERQNGNKKATAKVLGIAKSTLHEKLKKYGIDQGS